MSCLRLFSWFSFRHTWWWVGRGIRAGNCSGHAIAAPRSDSPPNESMGRVVRRSAVQAGWKRSWRYQRRVFNLEINRNSLVDAASPSILVRSRKTPSILIGLRVVDVLFPVAKGQRELIIGDRQSGKSTI
jgi:hypothetical protein